MNTASSAVLDLTCALIARPSITPDDCGCQSLLGERLERLGMRVTQRRIGAVDNLFAQSGQGRPHLMLLGHTDVVPPGLETAWSSAPFAPTIRGRFLYGRGAADMKSSVAAFVVALETFLGRADPPGTLSLLLTSDEEGVARDGVRAMVPWLRERELLPDACLIGEPSSRTRLGDTMRVGRRGSIQARLIVDGKQGHTAYAEPRDNPAHRAGPLLAALGCLQFDDGDQDFPSTRLQISNIQAGTGANNVTPGQLTVMFNLRNHPNTDSDMLETQLRSVIAAHDPGPWHLDWRVSGRPFGPAEGGLPKAVARACRDRLGLEPVRDTGGGTSDGRFLGPLGVACVELGPVNRTIHQVDECIELADLERLPGLYLALLEDPLTWQIGD